VVHRFGAAKRRRSADEKPRQKPCFHPRVNSIKSPARFPGHTETMPMTEQAVTFPSAGLRLSGVVHVPNGMRPGERRAAFIVLHGFGSNKTSSNTMQPTKVLGELGYVVFRFDMRGCGESEGEFGRVICLEQVEDTRSALSFLADHPAVDPERIGVIGSSFGGAVAVYTGGVDERVAAVVSNGGWGDGERKFRGQHKSTEEWGRFTNMLKEGREHRAKTGKSLMVPRYDIVPIPPHLRNNLASNSIHSFPAETAHSMFDFRADDVVGGIAPRPLLLLHAANDSVTPTEQSIELFKRAGQPTELHLISDADHFMFGEGNTRIWNLLRGWLGDYFPAMAAVKKVVASAGH
jgi:dipeptidyl aminopeptidase/acylaminoacyl peptidase